MQIFAKQHNLKPTLNRIPKTLPQLIFNSIWQCQTNTYKKKLKKIKENGKRFYSKPLQRFTINFDKKIEFWLFACFR